MIAKLDFSPLSIYLLFQLRAILYSHFIL